MQTGKVVGEAKTIGELKKAIEQLPDDMEIKGSFDELGCQLLQWSGHGNSDYIEIMDLEE